MKCSTRVQNIVVVVERSRCGLGTLCPNWGGASIDVRHLKSWKFYGKQRMYRWISVNVYKGIGWYIELHALAFVDKAKGTTGRTICRQKIRDQPEAQHHPQEYCTLLEFENWILRCRSREEGLRQSAQKNSLLCVHFRPPLQSKLSVYGEHKRDTKQRVPWNSKTTDHLIPYPFGKDIERLNMVN